MALRDFVRSGEAGFVLVLLLALVGLSPFDSSTTAATSGAGNLIRQLCYLAAFALIAVTAWKTHGRESLKALPITFLLLLGWCVASALWSLDPTVTLRRAGLQIVLVISIFLAIQTIGAERALKLLRWVLGAILLVNWISIALLPQAVHPTTETDPALVGNWRGLYFHKNIAGGVSALTAFLFFFTTLSSRRLLHFGIFAGALGFTVMTQSKSSLAFLPIALLFGLTYRLAWQRPLDRLIALVALTLLVVIIGAGTLAQWNLLHALLTDPGELTGRTAIWRAELAHIADHPLLGSGFGSFADTSAGSPLRPYIGSAWIEMISHGHSGYLQLGVTIGLIGLALAIAALIVQPARAFWQPGTEALPHKAMLLAVFTFVLLHNLLESDFLEGDGPVWVCFLIVLSSLRNLSKPAPHFHS